MPDLRILTSRSVNMAIAALLMMAASLLSFSAGARTEGCQSAAGYPVSVHCGGAPGATFDDRGRLWVAFVQDQQVFVSYSDDTGKTFSRPVAVNPVPEDAEYNGENRPKILVSQDAVIYVSWTLKTSPRFTGEIRFSRSTDGGKSFSEPRTVNDDGLFTGHRFESLFQTESGLLYLVWIDKRDLEASTQKGEDYTGAAVYYAVSRDQGRSFSQNYRVANHSCECCRIAVAPGEADNVAIFWRHVFGADTRDHAIAILTPGGQVRDMNRASYDDWQINACPHHGPTMIPADESGNYHLGWFTNGNAHQGIYYGRYSFTAGRTVNVRRIDGNPGAGHPFLQTFNGTLYLVWKGFDGQQSLIRLMTSSDDGKTWSEAETLATTSQGSDYPLIVRNSNGLFLSWLTDEHGYIVRRISPGSE